MSRVIRATINGPNAQLGKIAASDVARLILNLERVLARAAYVALGRERPFETGRHAAAIEKATRLTFAGVERGSLVGLLALPDAKDLVGSVDENTLPIQAEALGEAAFDQLLAALRTDGVDVDRHLAEAVATMAEELGVGDRTSTVELVADGSLDEPAVIDRETRVRMRTVVDRSLASDLDENTVAGRLVEADFEQRTARLQPATGRSVRVSFTDELDDDIHRALREVATLEGLITYDRGSKAARKVELRRVVRSEQLVLTSGEHGSFFEHRSVADLQEEQGVSAIASVGDLRAFGLTDEDREALSALAVE